MLKSKLIPYSIGVVLEDKKPDSDILKVQASEILTDVSGDLSNHKEKVGDIESTNILTCVWINYSDVRDSANDMVKGEKVMVLRYADTEMYFWYSIGRSNDLRKLEHILWLLSNTEEDQEKPEPDNQLFLLATTREGYIELTTPANRKEKALYHIKLDFKKGMFTFKEDNDNMMTWDAVKRHIEVRTNTVTYDINKMTILGDVIMKKTLTVFKRTLLKSNLIVRASAKISSSVKAATGRFGSHGRH